MSDPHSVAPARPRKTRWGFARAAGVILFVMAVGELVGRVSSDLPQRLAGGGGLDRRDGLVLAFLVCSLGWAWLSRDMLKRFFRSMYVGVTLVVLVILSVTAGVLVPQMQNFEDPKARITPANYEEEYSAFRWAVGYFLYHIGHVYGIGMPEADVPPPALESLERFGNRYGFEERANREKRMQAALSGREKTQEIRELVDRHDPKLRRAFDVATVLRLNRAYKSGWFATLVGLLGVAIFLNTFRGKPSAWFTVRRAGFFVTHIGMLVLILGGGVSKLFTKRGILHLDLEEPPRDEYWLFYDPKQPAELPFHVGLERFARKEWMALEVDFPKDEFSTRPPTFTLWPGKTIDLDWHVDDDGVLRPRLHLEVEELHDHARVDMSLREAEHPGEQGVMGAIARFEVTTLEPGADDGSIQRVTREAAVVPGIPRFSTYSDPAWQFRIAARYGSDSPEALAGDFPDDEALVGLLWIRETTGDEASERPYEARVGEEIEVAGGYTVRIERAMPNYVVDRSGGELPSTGTYPASPAVVVEIRPPGGGAPERRVVRQDLDPLEHGLQANYTYAELLLYFVWDEWYAPGPPRWFLHWGPGSDPVLVSETGAVTAVREGEPLPIGASTEVVPERFFRYAVLEREVLFDDVPPASAGDVDPSFYSRDRRGLVLAVVEHPGTAEETRQVIRMASGGDLASTWRSDDEGVALRFFENTAGFPFEWRSVLSVWEEGPDGGLTRVDTGTERDSEIRVNDYFYWDGWSFFQTNADARFPTYSGIGVVYDPGIPVVLFGMYTIIAGTLLAFIVRPIVLARRRES